MSLEAWGDEDGDDYVSLSRLIEQGWISPDDVSKALVDVMNERSRQQDVEGWTPEHDDQHVRGEMAKAAVCYATHAIVVTELVANGLDKAKIEELSTQSPLPRTWPWDRIWWKPGTARRDLVKAAALLLAEIERRDRAAGGQT